MNIDIMDERPPTFFRELTPFPKLYATPSTTDTFGESLAIIHDGLAEVDCKVSRNAALLEKSLEQSGSLFTDALGETHKEVAAKFSICSDSLENISTKCDVIEHRIEICCSEIGSVGSVASDIREILNVINMKNFIQMLDDANKAVAAHLQSLEEQNKELFANVKSLRAEIISREQTAHEELAGSIEALTLQQQESAQHIEGLAARLDDMNNSIRAVGDAVKPAEVEPEAPKRRTKKKI